MQEAAETISVPMYNVYQEYAKVKAKAVKTNQENVQQKAGRRQEGLTYVNPLLQHLLRLMSY